MHLAHRTDNDMIYWVAPIANDFTAYQLKFQSGKSTRWRLFGASTPQENGKEQAQRLLTNHQQCKPVRASDRGLLTRRCHRVLNLQDPVQSLLLEAEVEGHSLEPALQQHLAQQQQLTMDISKENPASANEGSAVQIVSAPAAEQTKSEEQQHVVEAKAEVQQSAMAVDSGKQRDWSALQPGSVGPRLYPALSPKDEKEAVLDVDSELEPGAESDFEPLSASSAASAPLSQDALQQSQLPLLNELVASAPEELEMDPGAEPIVQAAPIAAQPAFAAVTASSDAVTAATPSAAGTVLDASHSPHERSLGSDRLLEQRLLADEKRRAEDEDAFEKQTGSLDREFWQLVEEYRIAQTAVDVAESSALQLENNSQQLMQSCWKIRVRSSFTARAL